MQLGSAVAAADVALTGPLAWEPLKQKTKQNKTNKQTKKPKKTQASESLTFLVR